MKKSTPDILEAVIQGELEKYLIQEGWIVKSTHGNIFQFGFPDIYAAHRRYGSRWIEVKRPTGYKFMESQIKFFHQLTSAGVGVWILTAANKTEYDKLFKPANWYQFLQVMQHTIRY